MQLTIRNSPYRFSTRTLQFKNTVTRLQWEVLRVLNTSDLPSVQLSRSKFSDKHLVQRQRTF